MHSDQTVSLGHASTHVQPLRRQGGEAAAMDAKNPVALVELLRRSPELAGNRSFIIEKAVDEFKAVVQSSPTISLGDYCTRFAEFGSSVQSSIYRQLEVERFLSRHSWLTAKLQGHAWPGPGDQYGSFRVLEEVGHGAIARVYLCKQPELGHRQVIVKVSDSAFLEANILGRLRHPNIVPIYSIERDPATQRTMLCMPFLGRSTLNDFIDLCKEAKRTHGCSLQQAARHWEQPSDRVDDRACPDMRRSPRGLHDCVAYMGERLADALAYAHRHDIVHGDIKPSNILLSRSGEPLLMDFNLSGDAARSIIAKGGTLPYMPPEQLHAVLLGDPDAGSYGPRSDIFSLGVVLYEALTGRFPFPLDPSTSDSARMAEMLIDRQRQGCVPLRTVDSTISAFLAQSIERCLAFQPGNRLSSAEELRSRLAAEGRLYRRAQRHVANNCRKYALTTVLTATVCLAFFAYQVQRPARQVRLFQQAMALQQARDFTGAETRLTQALAIQPGYRDAQFELARTTMLRNELKSARDEFFALYMVDQSPRAAAYVAYCFNLLGDPTSANTWYETAINLDCDAPEVHNNLAVSYELGGSSHSEAERLRRSENALRRALQQLPSSPQVRLNWICLAIRKAHLEGAGISPETLDICRQLASQAPNCRLVHERVATAFAIASEAEKRLREEGLDFLKKAVELGSPTLDDLKRSARWNAYRDAPQFGDLIRSLEASDIQPVKSVRTSRLLEPASLGPSA